MFRERLKAAHDVEEWRHADARLGQIVVLGLDNWITKIPCRGEGGIAYLNFLNWPVAPTKLASSISHPSQANLAL